MTTKSPLLVPTDNKYESTSNSNSTTDVATIR